MDGSTNAWGAWLDRLNPFRQESPERARIGRAVVVQSVVIAGAAAFYGVVYLALGMVLPALGALSCAGLPLAPWLLKRTGSEALCGHLMALIVFLCLLLVVSGTGGASSPAQAWLLLPSLLATQVAGRTVGVVWAGLAAAACVFFSLTPTLHRDTSPVGFGPVFGLLAPVGLILCVFLVVWSLEAAQQNALRSLRCAQEAAEGAHRSARVILDHVTEGLVMVGSDGRLESARSAALDRWFGASSPDARLWDLFREASVTFSEHLEFSWAQLDNGLLPPAYLMADLPCALSVGSCHYRVTYNPVSADPLGRTLVVVTDISHEAQAEQLRARQREMLDVFLRISRDRRGVRQFFEEARDAVAAIAGGRQSPEDDKRLLHTLKGNAGLFGMRSLAARIHELEGDIDASGLSAEGRRAVQATWADQETRFASLLGGEDGRLLTVERAAFEAVVKLAEAGLGGKELAPYLRRWTMDPVEEHLSRLADRARSLALRLGKGETCFSVEAEGLYVPEGPEWRRLWSSTVHVVRNSLEHGIEDPSQRLMVGKPPSGHVRMVAEADRSEFRLVFEDDGRGIDWGEIRARARDRGLPVETHDDLVRALLADGVTTRRVASETAGRGMGTAALRDACERLGGSLRVESEWGRGTRFVLRFPAHVMEPQPGFGSSGAQNPAA